MKRVFQTLAIDRDWMNWKISRNEEHKYSNEEKFALGEDENTSALININQDDDSNNVELCKSCE